MRRYLILCALASAALAGSPGRAAVLGALGGGTGSFLTLSAAGLNGGTIATLSGGNVLTGAGPFAANGGTFGNSYLAAGQPAMLNFVNSTTYFSFLWGSPDVGNSLNVATSAGGSYNFNPTGMGFSVTDGRADFSQYVQFFTNVAGETITSATFTNAGENTSFEAANFSGLRSEQGVSAVPEPATWSMLLLGFGAIGFSFRRRKQAAFQRV